MRKFVIFAVILTTFNLGDAFKKYGRSCGDIGCTSKEKCVIVEDACTNFTPRDECGKYPTCVKVTDVASCQTYVCPPTKICRMDRGEPKCFDDPAAALNRENKQVVQSINPGPPAGENPNAPLQPNSYPNSYPNAPQPAYNPNYPQNPYQQPQNPYAQNPYAQNPYPQNPNQGLYPNLPSGNTAGGTTSRPNVYQPGQHANGGGYTGGAVGSGYPGGAVGSGYPQQPGGYPQQPPGGYAQQPGRYPAGQNYPGQYYPGQTYPAQYPGQPNQGNYPRQGYNPSYPTQGGGGNYPRQGGNNYYGQKTQKSGEPSSNPILDTISNTLKTIGTNFLKDTLKIKL